MRFDDIKMDVIAVLQATFKEKIMKYDLIEGFVQMRISQEIDPRRSESYIPSIGILNRETGQIMVFSVFSLLPDLKRKWMDER